MGAGRFSHGPRLRVGPRRVCRPRGRKLNTLAIAKGWLVPVTFADGRKSRAVPHQTQVNDWLGEMDLIKTGAARSGHVSLALEETRKKGLLPRELC